MPHDRHRLLLLLLSSLLLAQFGLGYASDSPPTDGSYRIVAGDVLGIAVFGHQDLTIEARVSNDGHITLPLIGRYGPVIGNSDAELGEAIRKRLADGFLANPIVTVSIKALEPRRIYLLGSVTTPGSIDLSPFTPMTALQAISRAGGYTSDANQAEAKVVRMTDDGSGRRLFLPIPDIDVLADVAKDVDLRPNDLIVVPRLDKVYIVGAVNRSGAQNLPAQGTLTASKAIALAGGFGRFAKQSQVQILRSGAAPILVDVQAILAGSTELVDPVLQPGDIISVSESRF